MSGEARSEGGFGIAEAVRAVVYILGFRPWHLSWGSGPGDLDRGSCRATSSCPTPGRGFFMRSRLRHQLRMYGRGRRIRTQRSALSHLEFGMRTLGRTVASPGALGCLDYLGSELAGPTLGKDRIDRGRRGEMITLPKVDFELVENLECGFVFDVFGNRLATEQVGHVVHCTDERLCAV